MPHTDQLRELRGSSFSLDQLDKRLPQRPAGYARRNVRTPASAAPFPSPPTLHVRPWLQGLATSTDTGSSGVERKHTRRSAAAEGRVIFTTRSFTAFYRPPVSTILRHYMYILWKPCPAALRPLASCTSPQNIRCGERSRVDLLLSRMHLFRESGNLREGGQGLLVCTERGTRACVRACGCARLAPIST